MEFNEIKELDKKYSIITYPRKNLCFTHGDGNCLYDTNGRCYVDFVAGLGENCLGYKNVLLNQAICSQADKLINCSNLYYSEMHALLSQKLCENSAFTKCCLSSSIWDTFLITATMVRKYRRAAKDNRNYLLIVTDYKSEKYNAMRSKDLHIKVCAPDINEFKAAFTEDVCAVVLLPVQVEIGVKICKFEFLLSAYAMCKAANALIIYDETGIGLGRTGTKFAFENYGIQPDIVMLSRGLGGGISISAVLARGELVDALQPSDRISSFRISSVAAAAALAVLEVLDGELEGIKYNGEYLISKLSKLSKHNFVSDIRGIGLLAGVELTPNLPAARIVGQLENEGFLIDETANNTLRITPPFTITVDEIDRMCDALAAIFAKTNI